MIGSPISFSLAVNFTALFGIASVFCSAMIYVDTRRAFWSHGFVHPKFFGTVALLGAASTACVLAWVDRFSGGLGSAIAIAIVAAVLLHTLLAGWETRRVIADFQNPAAPAHRSALVMWSLCKPHVLARCALYLVSTSTGTLALADLGNTAEWATVSLTFTLSALTIERFLFFTAVEAPRMPGVG